MSGTSRSISAAFWPMFWARAWHAMWTATPPGSGANPSTRPSFLAMSTRYSLMSDVAAEELHGNPMGALSGPNFAGEAAAGDAG